MKLGLGLAAVALMASIFAIPAEAEDNSAMGQNDAVSSGEEGARAGTLLYNSMNPSTPLPLSSGDTVRDTIRNMGAGQSTKEAWSNAAASNAGFSNSSSQPQSPSKGSGN
jgi:hypothetical protein